MKILDAIRGRRSIREFTDRAITREDIEPLLEAAVHAPNHRLTQPWRFYVMGPDARRAYGAVLGERKAKKVEDAAAARDVVNKVADKHAGLPMMLAVAVVLDDSPEIREEDYAATYMAIQNLSLAAHASGLGTHIKTGAVMDDPRSREALAIPEGERIVATIELGEPAAVPAPKPRRPADEQTTWLP